MRSIKPYTIPLIVVLALFLTACTGEPPTFISEGVIEYDADVIDETHPMATLAPGSMLLKFKNNTYIAEMSTMGFFTTHFLADPKKKTLIEMVKVLDVKNAYIEDEKALAIENADYKLNFTHTKETKVIAGYLCKKVIASKVSDPADKFEVYYTEGLNVENANFANPYASLKGMLMEYRLKKFGLEMSFKAKSVKKEDVPDAEFELPPYYKIVTKEEMDTFFKSFE